MGVDALARELGAVIELLESRAIDADGIVAALEGLRTSVEELRIVEEPLAEQAEELVETHALVDNERRRYEDLFASAPTPYLVTDLVGTITESNAASADLLGVPSRFLVGKPVSAFVSLPERREFRRMLLGFGAQPIICEYRLERRGEVPFDAEVMISPVVDASSRAIEALRWAIRDVTDERQDERRLWELNEALEDRVEHRTAELTAAYRELAAQRAQFEAIVQQLPAAVIVADGHGHVVLRNSRAEELFGEAVGRFDALVGRLADVEGRPVGAEALLAVPENGTVTSLLLDRPNGEPVLLEATVAEVESAEGLTNRVYVFHDVTVQRRRDLAQREFVVNAAHELRTPLASIVSAIEVLQAGGKDDADTRDTFLGHLERESGRLVRLARSLLLLSRAQAHEERPQLELVPLRQGLMDIADGMRAAPDVKVNVDCDEELAALVNEDLLRQALSSLADNAARYTDRGTITLRAHARDERRVAVEVVDTGPGLSEEERALVTHRFVRGGRSRDGFGLGLAIAAEAARAAGGELELESQDGRGTTARVVVQLARLVTV
jgi:two-component system, OmpR family, phosphate regulon sensor histidine kinase PhoR